MALGVLGAQASAFAPGGGQVLQAQEAAEKFKLFVILSEAKSPSSVLVQFTERFFGENRASE
jgi:hypothetical protein